MSGIERQLIHARQEAADARARLTGTLVELQGRLKPGALLEEAVEDLREKAEELAKDGVEMIRARPFAAAGIIAAILAYVFRGTLWDAIAVAFSRDKATDPLPHEFHNENGAPLAPAQMENER